MKPITKEDIKVLGRIVNISTENVVADASQVWDSKRKKNQEKINDDLIDKTGPASETKYGIVRLAANGADQDSKDVVTIDIMRKAISDTMNAILEDPNGTLLDQLNSIRELAEALDNNPDFASWINDQLANKVSLSDFNALERRVRILEQCCAEVKEYLRNYSISWNQAKGGDHVTLSKNSLKYGNNTVMFTIDEGYYLADPINTTTVDGSFTSISCTEDDGDYTITLVGVESNIQINARVKKAGTYTISVAGGYVDGETRVTGINDGDSNSNTWYITAEDNTYDLSRATITATIGGRHYTDYVYRWNNTTHDWEFFFSPEIKTEENIIVNINIPHEYKVYFNVVGGTASPSEGYLTTDPLTTITPNTGYTLLNPSFQVIYPNDTESYTFTEFNSEGPGNFTMSTGKLIWHDESNGDVTCNVILKPESYTITYQGLSGFQPVNSATTAVYNSGFATSFVRHSGVSPTATYTITSVVMGGTNITSTAVVNNNVSIQHVTGNVVITVSEGNEEIDPFDPVEYPTINIVVNNGTASPSSGNTTGGMYPFTSTITANTGYTLTNPTITCKNTSNNTVNNDYTVSLNNGTLSVTGDSTHDVTVTITLQQSSTPTPTYGTVTVVPDHGTASPASFSADGTSHTITITPASGYTTTGMTATTANNDLTVSVSGNKVTVTGTSSSNATINVTVPAESTPTPTTTSADIIISPAEAGTRYTDNNVQLGQSYSATLLINSAYEISSDNITMSGGGTITRNGNVVSTANVTGAISGTVTCTLKPVAPIYDTLNLEDVVFDAFGRTNAYSSQVGARKGTLTYGSHDGFRESAGDCDVADPNAAGYAYGEILLPDITTLNVQGNTNEEKVRNLINNTTIEFCKIDNNLAVAQPYSLPSDANTPFSITNGSSITGNTYISNTNNINIRLDGNIPVIDVTCSRFTNSTPTTSVYPTDNDGWAIEESNPIFGDYNYGTNSHLTGTTAASRQYVADSMWADIIVFRTTIDSSYGYARLLREGYAICEIGKTSDSPASSTTYTARAFPISAFDRYDYTITDGTNTLYSGTVTPSGTASSVTIPDAVDTETNQTVVVTVTAVPKSTASASNLTMTKTYDYSS